MTLNGISSLDEVNANKERVWITCVKLGHDFKYENVSDTQHKKSCKNGDYTPINQSHTISYKNLSDTQHNKSCSVCGFTKNENHTKAYSYNNTQHTISCNVCNKLTIKENHSYTVKKSADVYQCVCGRAATSHIHTSSCSKETTGILKIYEIIGADLGSDIFRKELRCNNCDAILGVIKKQANGATVSDSGWNKLSTGEYVENVTKHTCGKTVYKCNNKPLNAN